MRITSYVMELNEDRISALVKESSRNYPEINRLDSPKKIVDMFNLAFNAKCKAEEYIWLLALDKKCHLIGIFEISHGTVDSSIVTPREVFIRLCLCGATMFVLVHNHPSGETTPSQDDIKTTQRMKDSGKIMGIELIDHIIIGETYYSFNEAGIISAGQ